MERLTATAKVSEDGKLTLTVPETFRGEEVRVTVNIEKKRPDVPRDKNGWPIGFWEDLAANPIIDSAFKRYPQGEAEPPPSFE